LMGTLGFILVINMINITPLIVVVIL